MSGRTVHFDLDTVKPSDHSALLDTIFDSHNLNLSIYRLIEVLQVNKKENALEVLNEFQ